MVSRPLGLGRDYVGTPGTDPFCTDPFCFAKALVDRAEKWLIGAVRRKPGG